MENVPDRRDFFYLRCVDKAEKNYPWSGLWAIAVAIFGLSDAILLLVEQERIGRKR